MNAFRSSGEQRRHLMANILILDQTADELAEDRGLWPVRAQLGRLFAPT
jgi:hypothetical protein